MPPLAALYQYTCSGEVAESVTVPVPQRLALLVNGGEGTVPMIACTAVRVSGLALSVRVA